MFHLTFLTNKPSAALVKFNAISVFANSHFSSWYKVISCWGDVL